MMKSYSIVALALLVMLPFLTFAQQNDFDALYLNNGSVLRGKVLESTPGMGVRIEFVGNNVLFFPEDEIEKIVMREGTMKEVKTQADQASRIEIFPQISLFGGADQSAGITTTIAYKFPFRLSTGIGTGVEWFNGAMLPVLANVNYKILPGTLSPFFYGQAGYSFSIENSQNDYYYYGQNQENHGGFLCGIGAGIRKDFSPNTAITFSIGYRYQQTKITSEYSPYYDGDPSQIIKTERTEKFNRIALSVGIIF